MRLSRRRRVECRVRRAKKCVKLRRREPTVRLSPLRRLARPSVRQKTCYVPNTRRRRNLSYRCCLREIESCIASYATPPRGAANAVDLGCGAQPFRALLEQIGYSYCGVDANSNQTPDIVWAMDGPLPEELRQRGPFDFLLCTEVLEHVADWHAAFANFGYCSRRAVGR